MKKYYILIFFLIFLNGSFAQLNDLSDNQSLAEGAYKSLKAATGMCTISFLSQAIGGGLILGGMEAETDKEMNLLAFGLVWGIGGVGMQTNNAILTNRAYRQIQLLNFYPRDSLLQSRILIHINTARTLAIIQNITPIVAAAAGAISYSVHKKNTAYYYDEFFASPSFWIPAVSICFVGALLTIPEIVLIGKTRHDLDTYRQKIILGTTKYGIGIGYRF